MRELYVVAVEWQPGLIEHVTDRVWPSLEELAIQAEALDAARVVPALSRMPKLRRLLVRGTENLDELCEAIAASPIVSQLEQIELRQGVITRRGVDALGAAALRSLKTLELGSTAPDSRARLQHLAPTVRVHQDE